jgi:signal recognition particle subunit SRP54
MASRILGLGDVLTLIEKAQAHVDERDAKEMEDRLLSGRLTMEDWLGQMRQLRQMGSLESILGMMPGMGKQIRQMGNQMPTEKDLSHLEAIVLSMTPEERRRPEIIKGARRKRIALGSGTDISEVNRMLKGFDQMQQLFKQLGGGKGSKGVRGKMRMLKNLQGLDPTQLGGL